MTDYYEPCEPELERAGLAHDHFKRPGTVWTTDTAEKLLDLFRRCDHKHEIWDPNGWAACNVRIQVGCDKFIGDAMRNGCSVETCPLKLLKERR